MSGGKQMLKQSLELLVTSLTTFFIFPVNLASGELAVKKPQKTIFITNQLLNRLCGKLPV